MKHNRFFAFLLLWIFAIGSGNRAYSAEQPIAGSSQAQLTIVEYVDFQCSFCAKGSAIVKKLLQTFDGKVKLELRNYPLKSHSPASVRAAEAFEALTLQSANLADKFQDELFSKQQEFIDQQEPFIYATAEKIGADVAKMKADMRSDLVAQKLDAEKTEAETLGIQGTPAFEIGKQLIIGVRPYPVLKAIVEKQLQKGSGQ